MTEEEFFEDTWGSSMTKEEFVKEAVGRASHLGEEPARKAAQWVANEDGPDRRHFPRVSSLAAVLAEKQAGTEALWPVSPLSPEASVRSDAIERWVRPWAEAIRRELFQTTAPPFATSEDAIAWIEGESKKYARKAQTHTKHVHKWQQQAKQSSEGLSRYGLGMGAEITCWMILYSKDGSIKTVPATSPTLHRLAYKVKRISDATGWKEPEAVLYLLVKDVKPVVPRYTLRVRLKTATSPQGVSYSRQVAELTLHSADLSLDDLRKLYRALRQQGVAKKKPLTKQADAVWKFVNERRPSQGRSRASMEWRKVFNEWNDAHNKPKRKRERKPGDKWYASLRGFRKAWERVETIRAVQY